MLHVKQLLASARRRALKVSAPCTIPLRRAKLQGLLKRGLPHQMGPVVQYLVTGKCDAQAQAVAKQAEERRREIANQRGIRVPILYSPRPATSAAATPDSEQRPQHGPEMFFTMEKVAQTGKNRKWGIALYLLAREFGVTTVLELGACAGISAMYLSAAPSVETLITVEGTEALAQLAEDSLNSRNNAWVVNKLFSDAIATVLPALDKKLDMVFIDGHHEKVATIRYFESLLPYLASAAVVIFDDISWSQDMREAWNILRNRTEFTHTMDMGTIGVCIIKALDENPSANPVSWDLQPIVGKCRIGDPWGWKQQSM